MTSAILPDLFVSRHQGAVEWARRQGLEVRLVSHLNPGDVRPGQRVIGTLPAHLAAEVCLAGGIYLHLCLDLPPLLRGQDLSADQMQACRARLLPIWAEIRDCGMAAGPAAAMPPRADAPGPKGFWQPDAGHSAGFSGRLAFWRRGGTRGCFPRTKDFWIEIA